MTSESASGAVPFNQDAATHEGYIYTNDTTLGSRYALQRTTEAILGITDFTDKTILEMGCGDGFFSFHFWDQGHPKALIGVDLAENAIDVANRHKGSRPIQFQVGNTHQIPLEDNHFDLVIIQWMLHHDDNVLATIQEAFRLAPEILIHEPNGNNPGLKIIEKLSPYHRAHGERSFSMTQMIQWIEAAGGAPVRIRYSGFVPMFSR